MSKFEPEATKQTCWNCRHSDKSCVLTSYPGQIRCTLFDQLVYTNQTECLEDKSKEVKKDEHSSFVEGEAKKGWDAAEIKAGVKDLSERIRELAKKALFENLRAAGGWCTDEPEVRKFESFTAEDGHKCHWEYKRGNGWSSFSLIDDTMVELNELRKKAEKKEEEAKIDPDCFGDDQKPKEPQEERIDIPLPKTASGVEILTDKPQPTVEERLKALEEKVEKVSEGNAQLGSLAAKLCFRFKQLEKAVGKLEGTDKK